MRVGAGGLAQGDAAGRAGTVTCAGRAGLHIVHPPRKPTALTLSVRVSYGLI